MYMYSFVFKRTQSRLVFKNEPYMAHRSYPAFKIIINCILEMAGQIIFSKTRLLGHPEPQMYPPVALNQYSCRGQQNS